jgi:hypothetical protein
MRYFFDSFDGHQLIVDEDGLEFLTIALTRDAAIAALVGIAKDNLPNEDRQQSWIRVRDADGVPAFTATMTLEIVWP